MNRLLGLGDLWTVSKFGYGGDATLNLVREGGGLGLRAAGGLQLLQGHEVWTGRIDYYLYDRQGNRECDELGNLFQRRSL